MRNRDQEDEERLKILQTIEIQPSIFKIAEDFYNKTIQGFQDEDDEKAKEKIQKFLEKDQKYIAYFQSKPEFTKELIGYKIGCTFGIGLFKKFSQPFFICTQCNENLEDETLEICFVCAFFCHRGHKLRVGNYG